MIESVSYSDLTRIKQKYDFFDFVNITNLFGQEYYINFDENISGVTFSDIILGKSRSEYDFKEEVIVSFVLELLRKTNCHVIITKYNEKWVTNPKMLSKLNEQMRLCKISNTFNGGIKTKDYGFIELVIKSVLRYNSFVLFLTDKLVVAPSDHMDVFIWCNDMNRYNEIFDIVSLYASKGLNMIGIGA